MMDLYRTILDDCQSLTGDKVEEALIVEIRCNLPFIQDGVLDCRLGQECIQLEEVAARPYVQNQI